MRFCLIFQAMDAAGKDSTIKHVMSGVNPQGCQVYSFKHPSPEELQHDFLWRCTKALPERGRIGIFNRSYYEEVLIVRVHPEILAAQRIPGAKPKEKMWQERFEDINCFEQHLVQQRHGDPEVFSEYLQGGTVPAFPGSCPRSQRNTGNSPIPIWPNVPTGTTTCRPMRTRWVPPAPTGRPGMSIPADHKWISRAMVAKIVTTTIDGLKLKYPEVSPQKMKQIKAAEKQLESEGADASM